MVCPTRIRSLERRFRFFRADVETPYRTAISEIVSPRPMVYRISSLTLSDPGRRGRIRPHEFGNARRNRLAQLQLDGRLEPISSLHPGFEIKPVSTSIEGMSGDLRTRNAACSTCFLCKLCDTAQCFEVRLRLLECFDCDCRPLTDPAAPAPTSGLCHPDSHCLRPPTYPTGFLAPPTIWRFR